VFGQPPATEDISASDRSWIATRRAKTLVVFCSTVLVLCYAAHPAAGGNDACDSVKMQSRTPTFLGVKNLVSERLR
jgi:hypothetical protein